MRGVQSNGAVIRKARKQRGMTQSELAIMADLDVKTVRKAEKGLRVDLSVVTAIARTLNVDVSAIIAVEVAKPTTEPGIARNLEIARRFVMLYDTGGRNVAESIQTLVTDDIELHCPAETGTVPFAGVFRGLNGLQQFFDAFYSFFQRKQGTLEPEFMWSETRIVAKFTDQVSFQGIEMPPHWVNLHLQFRDGLLCRVDDEFDYFNARRSFEAVMAQLGQSPPK